MQRCFICGHKMINKEELEYAICSNEKCPCSVELNPPKEKEEVNKEK